MYLTDYTDHDHEQQVRILKAPKTEVPIGVTLGLITVAGIALIGGAMIVNAQSARNAIDYGSRWKYW